MALIKVERPSSISRETGWTTWPAGCRKQMETEFGQSPGTTVRPGSGSEVQAQLVAFGAPGACPDPFLLPAIASRDDLSRDNRGDGSDATRKPIGVLTPPLAAASSCSHSKSFAARSSPSNVALRRTTAKLRASARPAPARETERPGAGARRRVPPRRRGGRSPPSRDWPRRARPGCRPTAP
jgi:hypothetical protein